MSKFDRKAQAEDEETRRRNFKEARKKQAPLLVAEEDEYSLIESQLEKQRRIQENKRKGQGETAVRNLLDEAK